MIRSYLRQLYRTAVPLLYGRRRFKLFTQAVLGDVNLRMLALASETDYFAAFLRPIRIHPPFGKSMLVIAPHQDDETIGCGGVMALQVASQHAAKIVMLTDGALDSEEVGMTRRQLMDLRDEESRRAASVIGLEDIIFLAYADLAVSAAEAAESLRKILIEREVDAVFAPFVLDAHPDHRLTNYILAAALADIPREVRVFGYEVWGLCIPNVIVVIDEVIEKKLEMLSRFDFANSALDYVHSTKGLNMYHSRMLGAGECKYAERFFEVPRTEYIDLVKRVQATELRLKSQSS